MDIVDVSSPNNDYMDDKKGKAPKAKFSPEDDLLLIQLVENSPEKDWFEIARQMKNRNARQCRERWNNYLDPNLHLGDWTEEEDRLLLEKHQEIGSHWNAISRFFEGRSGNSIRNRFLMIQRHQRKKNKKYMKKLIPIRREQPNNEYSFIHEEVSTEQKKSEALFDEIFSIKGLYDIFAHIEDEYTVI